jgi:tripartite-type tricarboxylate transporter receptor subunit TctC
MLHVSYKTETQELADLMGGFVDAAILGTPSATPLIRAGRVLALAVIGDKRSSALPEVATFPELGYKRLNRLGWFGVLVPAATPPARIAEFSNAIGAVLAEPAVAAKIREMGFALIPSSSPAEFGDVMRSDLAAWRQLIHDAGIQGQ